MLEVPYSIKLPSNQSGIERVNQMYLNVFKDNISLVCFKVDTMEMVAVNALTCKESEVWIFRIHVVSAPQS